MKLIAAIENDEIRLCSNLSESNFGKTHNSNATTQEGKIFDGKNYKIWSFDEVRSYQENGKDERTVFYCGKNPLSASAKTLAEYFEIGGEDSFKAASAVIKAITEAAKSKITLPNIGAGGIFVDLSSESTTLLFLPEDLFKYSCNGLSKQDILQLNAGWVNQTIYDLPALCFERAVIAYRLLSGRLPYPAEDSVERNSDILDRKFLPLEYCVNSINETLAKEINKALKLNSSVVNIPGKKQKGKSNEDLTPTADFPIELLEEAWKLSNSTSKEDDKEFAEKVENYIRMRDSQINLKRNVRRNSSIILGVLVIITIIALFISSMVKGNLEEYTSTGLTSIQTIQAYFKGVNDKDSVLLSNFSEGKNARNFSDSVGRIFVMDKQRSAYSHDNGFATPANWLLYITTEERYDRSGVYGITNLKIDGKPYTTSVELFTKKQKAAPVTKEGNITLENGSESVHKVEYYLIRTDGEEVDFAVEKISEIFTLTYKKNRWIITDFTTELEDMGVDCQGFKNDYIKACTEEKNDVVLAANSLRNKYPWLPEASYIEAEQARLRYIAEHPFE